MQNDLFNSAALDHKESGLRKLDELNFAAAIDRLSIARESDPYLADLGFLLAAAEFAQQYGIKPQTSATKLMAFWHAVQQSYENDDLPAGAYRQLLQIIARRLLQIAQFTSEGFCQEKEETLHRGVLHVVLQDWPAAHRELLNLVTSAREKARTVHWAYLGDAAYLLKRWKDANMAYVCALFGHPFEVDQLRLQHPDLRKLLQVLKYENDSERMACALWPVQAWMKDILQIPAGNTFLLQAVRQQRSILGSELMLEPEQRTRQFALCLYIDQSGLQNEMQFDVRHEMKQLAPELFAAYLREIEKRRKQK